MVTMINVDFVTREISRGSPDTQWWVQLSTAIVFGLIFATILTLIVTPSALMLRENIRNWYKKKITITHPEIKLKSTFDKNVPRRLHGIYSSTEKLTSSGITQRYFIKIIYELLQSTNGKIKENLPSYIRKEYSLFDRQNAMINIHLPESNDKLKKAIDRLKFEELFFNQLGFLLSKTDRLKKINGFQFKLVGDNSNNFYNESLPFELTDDQKKVIKEIRKDFNSGKQMNRLLQGDVGSGKTIVSLMIILIAIDNGYQSCILAQTEILPHQHFDSISNLLE